MYRTTNQGDNYTNIFLGKDTPITNVPPILWLLSFENVIILFDHFLQCKNMYGHWLNIYNCTL